MSDWRGKFAGLEKELLTGERPSAASAGYHDPVALLPCPDCGADPAFYCTIHSVTGREPADKNHIHAECRRCGFSVAVISSAKASVIRRFWNASTAASP